MSLSYDELAGQLMESRAVFGRMLLSWRRRNGWTQYTACNWAKEAGFEAISYGNLSVIEQGTSGELRHKAFWQLGELNRRIAERDWGPVRDQQIKDKLQGATPLGDSSVSVWTALEFWACYFGLRDVPETFRSEPPPAISQRRANDMCGKWRTRLRKVVAERGLEPREALLAVSSVAPDEQRDRFFSVLTGFANYTPGELAELWWRGDTYLPCAWMDRWEWTLSAVPAAA